MWHRDTKWINTVGKNGANRLPWCGVATNLQFVKKKKKKCSKVKHNKTRYACTCKSEPLKICHYIKCRAKNGIILGIKSKTAHSHTSSWVF